MRPGPPSRVQLADGDVFDLEEARSRAFRYLGGVVAGVSWGLNLLTPLLTDDPASQEAVFVASLALIATVGLGLVASRRSAVLAGTCLAAGLTGSIIWAVGPQAAGPVVSLLALPVVVAAAVAGPYHGFLWAALCSGLVLLGPSGHGIVVSQAGMVALVLTWASALVSWLGFRPMRVAAEWAWSSYYDRVELSEELRVRQGELGQLSKSLNEACDRLEQQNAALERARAFAEEARRQKAAFAAAISHELRTPVNLIVGLAEMLQRPRRNAPDRLPDSYRGDVDVIYRNACHISNLIDDILDLSQVDAHRLGLQRQPVRLAEVLEQAISVVARQYHHKGLYLRADVPEDLPLIRADPTRLRQVLLNLLSNAVRFTDYGGVSVAASLGDGEILVSVADTGVGIRPDDAPRAFEEFHRAGETGGNARGNGSGLGLAISKRLVELHGGSMWVESEPDRGSTFRFSLPLADSVAASPAAVERRGRAGGSGRGRFTIAVLGADEHAGRMIERYLDGYRVVVIADEGQLRRAAESGGVDALLVTSGDPVALAPTPVSGLAEVPVISCGLRTRRTLAREAGVAEYLVKPVTQDRLQAALGRLGRRVRSVLVVEDDAEMRRLLARMALAAPSRCHVREAENGAAALAIARVDPPDVVLLDLLMPELDGYGFVAAMRADARLREVPIVVITAMGREPEAVAVSSLTITRERGLTVGEFSRTLAASLDVLLSPAAPELEHTAGAPPGGTPG